MNRKLPLIIITGPTAAGKTKVSIELARKIDGEIISADSMQVYRHMDIGSAKITESEMQGIPHHLINVLEPSEAFNVVRFQSMAKDAMADIYSRNKIPIIVGGTGFYIQSVLYDINFTENDSDNEYRQYLEQVAKEQGTEALYQIFQKTDPESARNIHPNNVKRIIRALEYYHLTKQKISSHNEEQRIKTSPYNAAYFVLSMDRKKLYERINKRVDTMIENGLLEEVKALKNMGLTKENISMQGLGYKEMLSYLNDETDWESTVYTIKRDTRHFAKRQLTWFRNRESDAIWISCDPDWKTPEEITKEMLHHLSERGILYT